MPQISMSKRDILRGKVITPGWYRVRIEAIGEKLSSGGDSTNYPVEGTVLFNSENGSKDFEGFPIDWNFNSKAIGFATGFLESFGQEVVPDKRYELKSAEGKETDVFIENGEYQGRPVNRVNHKYRKPIEA